MQRILMVCLGNICRSPLAHGILESKLDHTYYIDSAGTASYHIGEPPDRRSIQVAKSNGIDISHQSARQFRARDFDAFDVIYAMDQTNYQNILDLAKNPTDKGKVKLFLDENPKISNKNVPDPYYGGLTDFELVFDLINDTCDLISDRLRNMHL